MNVCFGAVEFSVRRKLMDEEGFFSIFEAFNLF